MARGMIVREMGERYRGQGAGYWHQMGTVQTDPNITATEAAVAEGLDYQMVKRAISTRLGGRHHNIAGSWALIAEHAEPEVVAIVGNEFEPVQNLDLARQLDAAGLTGPGGLYSVDVVGRTTDSRLVFWALKDREATTIAGDEYRDHWLIVDGKDGNRALTMALTPVRTVCSNALAIAMRDAVIKIGIQHTRNAASELEWWLNIAPQLQSASRKSHELLSQLARIHVDDGMVEDVLAGAYPKPTARGKAQLYAQLNQLDLTTADAADVEAAFGAHGSQLLRVKARRDQARRLFESYGDDPEERNVAGTLLGIVNAVSDVENHSQPVTSRENAALSNLYGPRYQAQQGAMRAAVALATFA